MRQFADRTPFFAGAKVQLFVMGVAAGLTAQAIAAFWRWLRAPALGR